MSTSLTFPRRFPAGWIVAAIAGSILLSPSARSQAQAVKEQPKVEPKAKAVRRYSVPPTYSNVRYGDHERQVSASRIHRRRARRRGRGHVDS